MLYLPSSVTGQFERSIEVSMHSDHPESPLGGSRVNCVDRTSRLLGSSPQSLTLYTSKLMAPSCEFAPAAKRPRASTLQRVLTFMVKVGLCVCCSQGKFQESSSFVVVVLCRVMRSGEFDTIMEPIIIGFVSPIYNSGCLLFQTLYLHT